MTTRKSTRVHVNPLGHDVTVPSDAKIGVGVMIGGKDSAIGDKVKIGDQSWVSHQTEIGNKVKIGKRVFVGWFVHVGDNVTIGDHATILQGAIIGDNVTIGNNVVVKPGVTIDDNLEISHRAKFRFQPKSWFHVWARI